MTDPFVHLHVASGYSLQHGASHPETLVERAAEHGMEALALTDRDGVYGAVKFAKACLQAGIRPILGVDLAVEAPAILSFLQAAPGVLPKKAQDRGDNGRQRRSPARGGAEVDLRHPRFTALAVGRAGWAAVCRLTSATHLRGERGKPVCTLDLLAEHTADLFVLLGPHSDVGAAVAARRFDLADQLLARWRAVVPADRLLLEVVSHRGELALSSAHAARMLRYASEQRLPTVLTNLVRYADRDGATTADVLDAARRLVALHDRHIDRTNAEGYLKSGTQMAALSAEIAGPDRDAAYRLLTTTREVAERAMLDPHADLGLGSVHFPELEIVGASNDTGDTVLRHRAEAGLGRRGMALTTDVAQRLDAELEVIAKLGYANYFLTVADVVDLIRDMGVRVAARGSGAGSMVNYLLGISGVDPMAHGLLMERFLSPLRQALPDIDIDVESARRTEVYERILARYGGERCACVSMMDTYRVRHAIRDVGAALGLPLGEIDTLAKAFPHIRARDAKAALRELPELRASNIGGALSKDAAGADARLDLLFTLVERLDGLPRHVALHPCGVLLSDATLLDRTPVEASYLGFPMSQFDKDDVEDLGLLKLDVLGIRMQSAMAHALEEIRRVDCADSEIEPPDIDEIPLDDPQTFALIQSTHTLGCFQIESPGQRELVGKFGPETFGDIITDISLFRPGPVKSDMVTPFLRARQGWEEPVYLHPDLVSALEETCGVVVFHEQVLLMLEAMTGCTLAEADEVRRELGSFGQQPVVREWFYTATLRRGYDLVTVERVWDVLKAFASFGFCKAHAAAFALPTYQSAYLKAHHPAAFMAGVLTHDPGMYPKRLILDDVRQMGIAVLGLDVNISDAAYRVEKVAPWDPPPPGILGAPPRAVTSVPGVPDARDYGIRLALSEVKGIDEAEVARIVAGRPYASLTDFWHRARVARPVVERLVVAGAFDSLYGLSSVAPVRRRGQVTRRDLLLQVADLDRWSKPAPGARNRRARVRPDAESGGGSDAGAAKRGVDDAGAAKRSRGDHDQKRSRGDHDHGWSVVAAAARQSQAPTVVTEPDVQLTLQLFDEEAASTLTSGLPDMTTAERVKAELEILGLDVSRHVVDFYSPMLDALGITRSPDLVHCRSQQEVLVAGVKVATQTPPIRSGRRVVFLTLDDSSGPVDATFFEDAQGPYSATVFHSWLLVVRGHVRRTGRRGVSIRATGAWEMSALFGAWESGGIPAVLSVLEHMPEDGWGAATEESVTGAAESRSSRPVMAGVPGGSGRAGGMGQRRVLVHPSGFKQSPYADIKPAGEDTKKGVPGSNSGAPRKLWHSSMNSPGA